VHAPCKLIRCIFPVFPFLSVVGSSDDRFRRTVVLGRWVTLGRRGFGFPAGRVTRLDCDYAYHRLAFWNSFSCVLFWGEDATVLYWPVQIIIRTRKADGCVSFSVFLIRFPGRWVSVSSVNLLAR
jgi:hypothetical protein